MDWQAEWIWHPPTEKMDNFYLHARKVLVLDGPCPNAQILVTAGSLYKLYVNGEFVGRGPNPSDPSRYYYDRHEVGGLLRPGPNVVAATCHNYGEAAHGILGQNWGRGAFLLEMRDGPGGRVLLATDGSWRVLHAPEWDQDAPVNCTLLGDFKEIRDTRLETPDWLDPAFDDSGWSAPPVLGRPPIEPYTKLVEREIPFLGGERLFPVNAYWDSASVTYAWRDDWEVYHEQSLVPDSRRDTSGKPARAMKTHADFSPSILLDFGRIVTGYPEISITASAGGTLDVLYGEDLRMIRVDRFILRGGPQTLQPYNRRTFRYMRLLFVETPEPVEMDRVSIDSDTYPVERLGSFSCSDALLTRIWEVGCTTVQLSMLDHFVDCPWRERTIYGGDVYAENLIAHYAFGDPRLNRKTLRQMFAIQYPEGALPPYGPYRGCDGFYPSWSAFFGLAFLDHFALTGDRAFLTELWPALTRLLDWAVGQMENNTAYLIGDPAEGGTFDAWMAGEKVQFAAWSNLPFTVLLRRSAALGTPEEAHRYGQAADRMAAAIRERLIDEDGLCATWPRKGRPAQIDTAYWLWAGIPDRDEGRGTADALFGPSVTPITTPFHGLFVTEAAFQYGEDRRALDFIRRYWGSMLERGATTWWEHYEEALPKGLRAEMGASLCHGWSAGPTYSLPAHVLGVQPLEPGFAVVLVEPRPGDLAWAAGEVPTPHGPVGVRWTCNADAFRMNLRLPTTCRARVSLPWAGLRARVLVDGRAVPTTIEADRVVCDVDPGEHEIILSRDPS